MIPIRLKWLLPGAAFAAAICTCPVRIQAKSPADSFGLGSPFIVKADWQSTLLRVADLNDDGLQDFATVNNVKSLLQIYIQKKEGDQTRFEKREEVLENAVSDMWAADFNGDGLADLALASRDEKLTVRYQKKDGSLAQEVKTEAKGGLLAAGDLDRDGVLDLVVLDTDKIQFLYGKAGEGIETVEPLVFYNASTPATRPILCDLNGDGYEDVVYLDSQRRNRVLARFQSAGRQWGLETGFEITNIVDLVSPRLPLNKKARRKTDPLVAIDSKTRELRMYYFDPEPQSAGKLPLAGPYFLSSDARNQSDRDSLLACDLTGNGQMDILAASPRSSEMSLYIQDLKGDLETRSAASLSDISSLAVVNREKGALLFSLSDLEETVGVSEWDDVRGLSVPQFLDSNRKPLAMTTSDMDGSGKDDLVYIYKDEKSTLTVAIIIDPVNTMALRKKPRLIPVPGGDTNFEPIGMKAADVNGDGKSDLMIFSHYYPLRLLLQEKDMKFKSFATDQGMKKGIFNKVQPAQVVIADLEGDGTNEMLIARENFVRAYRLDSEGQLLTIYARGESGDFALVRHHEIKGVRGTRLLAADVNGDGKDDIVIYETDRAQVFYSGRVSSKLKTVWRRAPEDKDGKYGRIHTISILGDAGAVGKQLLAVEGTDHLMEFFEIKKDALESPERFFHFKLFDDENSVTRSRELRGQTQPRDLVSADVDGDGLADLVTLMHDNIIYYRQTKKK